MEHLRDLGTSHITLIPFGFQEASDGPRIRFAPDRQWFSESDSGIRFLAQQAHALGMGIILKPHIWVGQYGPDGQLRHEIDFENERGWAAWEEQYRRFILHYADLAAQINADVFVIGTELATAALERPEFWRDLAGQVRTRFSGKLTYAANWYHEFEDIRFWSELDLIGVQAYFPLSRGQKPGLEALKKGWRPHLKVLESLSTASTKPIMFTEIGYRSASGSAREPWRWASRQDVGVVEPDYNLQSNLYRAFFETVWPEPWFAGASIWKWDADSGRGAELRAIDFTPQQKPAAEVIRQGFQSRP